MCHDPISLPPIHDQPLTQASGADVVLSAADGTHFRTFFATPEQPSGTGIVVLPDVRGLHNFYRQLALRLAEQGHHALAIDYFGRSAGPEERASGVGFESTGFDFMAHAQQTTQAGLEDDFAAAVSHLRAASGCTSTFTIGFCFGGRNSYLSPTRGQHLNGCIGFYGSLGDQNAPGPLSRVAEMDPATPILALQSASDTDPERFPNAAFDAALTQRGIPHELVLYDAPHSFFDVKYAEHADVCADAWTRVQRFLDTYATRV